MSLRRGYKILRAAEGGVMFIFLLVGGGVMNILYCDKKSKCGNNYCSYEYDATFFEC